MSRIYWGIDEAGKLVRSVDTKPDGCRWITWEGAEMWYRPSGIPADVEVYDLRPTVPPPPPKPAAKPKPGKKSKHAQPSIFGD